MKLKSHALFLSSLVAFGGATSVFAQDGTTTTYTQLPAQKATTTTYSSY